MAGRRPDHRRLQGDVLCVRNLRRRQRCRVPSGGPLAARGRTRRSDGLFQGRRRRICGRCRPNGRYPADVCLCGRCRTRPGQPRPALQAAGFGAVAHDRRGGFEDHFENHARTGRPRRCGGTPGRIGGRGRSPDGCGDCRRGCRGVGHPHDGDRRNVAGAGPDGEFPDRQRYEGGRRAEGDDLLYGRERLRQKPVRNAGSGLCGELRRSRDRAFLPAEDRHL